MKTGHNSRRCPKCGGNMYRDSNYCVEGMFFTWYDEETCLQCGYTYVVEIPPKEAAGAVTPDRAVRAVKQPVAV